MDDRVWLFDDAEECVAVLEVAQASLEDEADEEIALLALERVTVRLVDWSAVIG